MAEQPKKGILNDAINLVSNRDEKAALEAAQKQMAEMQKKVTDLEASLAKSQAEVKAAKDQIYQLEQRVAKSELKAKLYDDDQARKATKAAENAAQAASVLETHTMQDDETLSHIALKYYGHATKKYWSIIYEANKDAIGSNPNKVRPGTVLKIPVLPEELKK